MTTNRPHCPVCGHETKKNGTTSKKTTRWRCKDCGHSFTRTTQLTHQHAATFRLFISWITHNTSLTSLAEAHGTSRHTLHRRLAWCWWIIPPQTVDPHRIHDQLFLDATFTHAGCLLIAATRHHVINWHWARTENSTAYKALIDPIPAPLMVVIDGGQGAYSAIRTHWPTTVIQRCLVHAQRAVRRHTTSRPRTIPGQTIYRLALSLTKITSTEQAATWTVKLHEFGTTYRNYLNQKTYSRDPLTGATTSTWTHESVRKAYKSLESLSTRHLLFNYLQPPAEAIDPDCFASTTNTLEGGINAPLKLQARHHRGWSKPHQRLALDWWLYLHTQCPDDPVLIAKDQQWGQRIFTAAHTLNSPELEAGDSGQPAGYDTHVDADYQHSMGIQQGWVGS